LEDGALAPLKQSHVDTGMGFERICRVLQGRDSNFETDIFYPLIEQVAEISGVDYRSGAAGTANRVVADHARMLTFALADGAIPSNEGRGYVVRRILRRAARFGRDLGVKEPFIHRLVGTVVDLMDEFYPEITGRAQHVSQVIKAEEEGFGVTLDRGLELFEEVAEKTLAGGGKTIGGREAFKLYDTYGFPFDLTVLMAREKGLAVDEEEFRACMENRQQQSRAEGKFAAVSAATRWAGKLPEGAQSRFVGYESDTAEASVLGADQTSIVLDRTPFYPEGGGQVADRGTISGNSFSFLVENVQRSGVVILHEGTFSEGGPEQAHAGKKAEASVARERRLATARNHTATHLLHRVLLAELGEAATQAGSLVAPDYLRFDFHHYDKLPDELILKIERRVNAEIRVDRPVKWSEEDYEEAVAAGAMALFTEKYDKRVRVVRVEGFSRELCGGTHVSSTGQIGAFVITGEGSVAAGIRRIEALTGERAVEYLLGRSHTLSEVEHSFSIPADDLVGRLGSLLAEQKILSRELARARQESSRVQMDGLLDGVQELPGGLKLLARNVPEADLESLKNMGDSFREKAGRGAALFATVADGKILFACAVSDDLVKEGRVKAGDLVARVAKIAGGGGGGKPHLATAGGRDLDKLDQALESFRGLVEEALSG
ncbi:MAG TPA: alanine--tRNA ligase, partial [Candidatus Glassbacteria bacterium]|nr:alanine--tRNA ligase [Candidatus Glassbacteria bacterium]